MSTEEERVQDLIHQMYEKAESTLWAISAEDIRLKRRRRNPQWPNPKLLIMVAAVILLLVVLLGVGIGSSRGRAHTVVAGPTAGQPLCQTIGAFVHIPANKLISISDSVIANAERSGYPSLNAAAIRFQTAITHQDEHQPGVSEAASEVLAVCTRLGI
jgi:hypothetical protein